MSFSIARIENMGVVLSEQNSITNSVLSISIPTTSTAGTRNVNLLGKKRVITIQGINIGTGYTNPGTEQGIKNFIADVENWVNEGIQHSSTVTDSFGHTYTCICTNFTWTRSENNPTWLVYSMTLVEGGLTA